MSYAAVGRKYGVSDNAVRKWLRTYAAEAGRAAGDPGVSRSWRQEAQPQPEPGSVLTEGAGVHCAQAVR
jgi:transposase-like protein